MKKKLSHYINGFQCDDTIVRHSPYLGGDDEPRNSDIHKVMKKSVSHDLYKPETDSIE